ncbi:MAG: hypothetical protein OEX77_03415 [Candidatus Bathyarchaeota archaeon]|nr:hypothetical protein [Candidatus Bathyarchaeota archaeon]
MIADFTSEDRNLICLNCARRIVSPEKTVTKYTPLNRYLIRRAEYADQVTLSFARIEGIIGDNLPLGAVRNRSWWSNKESSIQGQAWMNARWRVEEVNLQERIVTFKNAKGKARETGKKAGRTRKDIKPFIPPPVRTRIRRKPSKTRISLIQAKFKNVERQRSSIRSYRGKFKPKPAHEKRLYKPEAKPSKQDT